MLPHSHHVLSLAAAFALATFQHDLHRVDTFQTTSFACTNTVSEKRSRSALDFAPSLFFSLCPVSSHRDTLTARCTVDAEGLPH